MTNNVDPGFPGKPTVYPYYDPNDATKYANKDPNAPGSLNQIPTSTTYIWAYSNGTLDTSYTVIQQKTNEALRFKDGSVPTLDSNPMTTPVNPAQKTSPSVGGYYNTSDATVNTNPW